MGFVPFGTPYYWIMDLHNSIMDLHNSIMEIHK